MTEGLIEPYPRIFPFLETLTCFDLNGDCDVRPYVPLVSGCSFQILKKLHVGLRGEKAEEGFPNLLTASGMSNNLLVLEELRFSHIRTKREAAKLGGGRDEKVVVEDHLCESLIENEHTHRSRDCLLFVRHPFPSTFMIPADYYCRQRPTSITSHLSPPLQHSTSISALHPTPSLMFIPPSPMPTQPSAPTWATRRYGMTVRATN